MSDKCGSCANSCKKSYAIHCIKCQKLYNSKHEKLPTPTLNYFAHEMKYPKGESYHCKSFRKSDVMTPQNVNKIFEKPTKANLGNTRKKYNLENIMEKLMEMDIY